MGWGWSKRKSTTRRELWAHKQGPDLMRFETMTARTQMISWPYIFLPLLPTSLYHDNVMLFWLLIFFFSPLFSNATKTSFRLTYLWRCLCYSCWSILSLFLAWPCKMLSRLIISSSLKACPLIPRTRWSHGFLFPHWLFHFGLLFAHIINHLMK